MCFGKHQLGRNETAFKCHRSTSPGAFNTNANDIKVRVDATNASIKISTTINNAQASDSH